jgi:ribosomal protein S17E
MAFNNYSESEEDISSTSKFNEAFLKMHRIHRLQDTMNICGMNPLAFNNELQVFNYQAKVSACDGIMMEVWGKLDDEEKNKASQLKRAVERFMEKYPIYISKKNQVNNKKMVDVDPSAWNVLKNIIFEYECYMRELLSRTGYDSPNKDEYPEDEL